MAPLSKHWRLEENVEKEMGKHKEMCSYWKENLVFPLSPTTKFLTVGC